MSAETHQKADTQASQQFHHVTGSDGCDCPVHRSDGHPTSVPLGWQFADEVCVRPIAAAEAAAIYNKHHAYVDDIPDANITHHGIFFRGDLLGAITWRTGLCQHRKLRWDSDGNLLARRAANLAWSDLPDSYHSRAADLIDCPTDDEIAKEQVVSGGQFVRASRICIAIDDFPNLASCGLAKSQARFVRKHCQGSDYDYLVTFVRCDYRGSMIAALRGRGWRCTGFSTPSTPGNREMQDIYDDCKWRWICPVETVTEQLTMADITD